MLHSVKVRADNVRLRVSHPTEYRLFRRYLEYSMVGRRRFVDNIKLVRSVAVAGDLVECGAWRGGMSGAMAETLSGRHSVLFDSFEGLPDVTDRDGEAAAAFLGRGDRMIASEQSAQEAMLLSGSESFAIRRGWFSDTVPSYAEDAPSIAVLRLDGDWYDSTMVCLENLFPLVVKGGVVIVDDYGDWDGCTRAVHDYLSAMQRTEPIQHTGSGVTFILKR